MKCTIAFLISVTMLLAGVEGQGLLPGVYVETNPSATRLITEPSGNSNTSQLPTDFYGNSRAEVLWVDRLHQNAIAQHAAISGTGTWIQAGWYLNNERTTLYETSGTGVPTWTYMIPSAQFVISTDVAFNGDHIGVVATGAGCYSFDSASAVPHWVYNPPPGFELATSSHGPTIAVTDDGTVYATLAAQDSLGKLCLLDNSGDTIRTVPFEANTGIYGIDMTPDGSVICVSTYNAIYVFNADGSRRDSIPQYGQTVAKISADGGYLVKGDFNTRTCLYHWNGSNYDLTWEYYGGHPWVTAVAISDDGSTIMAGTYQYTPQNTGKVMLFDSSSATPLWQYYQYGDYVASCVLSEDGSIAVAGSWGQYGGTYGDVITVFNRSSSTPFFQVLDDIDEPGSIFSVDISRDGLLITASGKAVHAREFGNGGEVYAISTEAGIEHLTDRTRVQPTLLVPTPNPFSANLHISLFIPKSSRVKLSIYDVRGRLISKMFDREIETGEHNYSWKGTDDSGQKVSSGIYYLEAAFGREIITRKVILIAD